MELSLHPAKRARRAFLSEEGPHLEPDLSEEEKLFQVVVGEKDSRIDRQPVLQIPSQERLRDVVQATAELNQWMNALELLRGKEYLKLLPIRRESIGMKSIPLHASQKIALVHQRLQSALQILSRGIEQTQHVVDRRRLFSNHLQTLRPNWIFASVTDSNTRNISLSIDCSFARFTRRPLVNFTRQAGDHLIPLEIASEGHDAISISPIIKNKEYLNIRLEIIDNISLIPVISVASLDICHHNFEENSIQYFAFLNHHSHVSQQVFHSLSQGLKPCFHKAAKVFQNLDSDTSSNQSSYDIFLNSLMYTAREKSRLIFEISLKYSLLIEITPHRLKSSLHLPYSSLSAYLKEPCNGILRSIFISVVNQISSQDPPLSVKAAEKYRKAFIEPKDSLAASDDYHALVRRVVRETRIAICQAHTEAILHELALENTSIQRTYSNSKYWSQPKPAENEVTEIMVIATSSNRYKIETNGSSLKVTHLTTVSGDGVLGDEVVGKYSVNDTRCLAELLKFMLSK